MTPAAWLCVKIGKNEERKRQWEINKQLKREASAARLRAYERLCLLLERTLPEYMLNNIDLNIMNVAQIQQLLLKTIRMEFDHNLSQQIYVSDEVWEKILLARNEMGAFISAMAMQMPKGSNALDYAKVLITAYTSNGETPHQAAMDALKSEAKTLL